MLSQIGLFNIISRALDSHGIFIEKALRTFTNLYAVTAIAGSLSISDFSQFSFWLLVIGCLRIIIFGGYESYIFHSAAKYPRKARSELKIAIINRFFALLLISTFFTCYFFLFDKSTPIEVIVLGLSLLSFPLLICNDFFLGLKDNKIACLSAAVFFVATLILTQSSHYFAIFNSTHALLASSAIYAIPRLIESITFWLVIRKHFLVNMIFDISSFSHRNLRLFSTCFPLFLTSFIGTIYSFSDQLLTYSYYEEELMGLYNIAWKIPALFTLISGTVANFLYLKYSRDHFYDPNKQTLLPSKRIFALSFSSIAVLAFITSLAYCKVFLPVYFGIYFVSISLVYSLYLCFYVLNLFNLKSLLHLGKFKIILYKAIFSILFNLLLFFSFLETFGFLTAALSTLFSELIVSIVSTIYVQKIHSSKA